MRPLSSLTLRGYDEKRISTGVQEELKGAMMSGAVLERVLDRKTRRRSKGDIGPRVGPLQIAVAHDLREARVLTGIHSRPARRRCCRVVDRCGNGQGENKSAQDQRSAAVHMRLPRCVIARHAAPITVDRQYVAGRYWRVRVKRGTSAPVTTCRRSARDSDARSYSRRRPIKSGVSPSGEGGRNDEAAASLPPPWQRSPEAPAT